MPDQFTFLKNRGVVAWNKWRSENHETPYFVGVEFQGLDLHGVNFSNADLRSSDLQGTNLVNADLQGADFIEANLSGANLQHANLRIACLQRANLEQADLQHANLQEADLQEANLYFAKLEGANFEDADLSYIKIHRKGIDVLPKHVRAKFEQTFFVQGTMEKNTVARSIEFPPQYHQAGLSILNYFGTVLRLKYPDKQVRVRIEQEGLKVTMIVETKEGDRETIEKALDNYGLVITGKMPIQEYTDDKLLQVDLKNQLINAQGLIEMQRNLLAYREEENRKKDLQIERLLTLIGGALVRPVEINIPVTSISNATASPQINFFNQFPLLEERLNVFRQLLRQDSEEDIAIAEIQDGLKEIKNPSSAEEVKQSPTMSKLKSFVEGIGKTGSKTGKVLKGIRDGIKIGQDLADAYNSIAQWCGLPQVPKPFLKKAQKEKTI